MPKKSYIWSQPSRKLIIGFIGCCLVLFGILCTMFWGRVLNKILDAQMVLRPDSKMYDNWKKPPMQLSLDIYLFNWTNPEDFSNLSTKPILQQLGPYRFTEEPDKVDIQWHSDNASVTYRKKSDYYFDEDGSSGSLDDQIATLNAVALSAASKAKHWNSVRRSMVDVGLQMYGQEMFVVKTADELLFTGYQDDMIDIARAMPIFADDVEVPFDKFGWFYTRNGSADLTGTFNVYTGADDRSKMGQINSWNFVTHSGFFPSDCGVINGSAGEFQPPHLTANDNNGVALFTPDMCRTVPLEYVNNETIEGILGYKYVGGLRSVDNGTLYPENKCFCGGVCSPSGVMNISSCRFGSPVFMSYPHFYNADPFYVNQVEGLEPRQEDHEFYMILEPDTGLPLEVAARFQVNMLVEPIQGLGLYEKIPRIYFPLIWFEQKVRITPDLAGNMKIIPLALAGGQIFGGVCVAVGLILVFWYPVQHMLRGHRIYRLGSANRPDANKNRSSVAAAATTNNPSSVPSKNTQPTSSSMIFETSVIFNLVPQLRNASKAGANTTTSTTTFDQTEPTNATTFDTTPDTTAEASPVTTAEPTPVATPVITPVTTPEPTPHPTPAPTPKATPVARPVATPEITPITKPETPVTTLEATSEKTPASTPAATPEATAEPKPEATTEASSEAPSAAKPNSGAVE